MKFVHTAKKLGLLDPVYTIAASTTTIPTEDALTGLPVTKEETVPELLEKLSKAGLLVVHCDTQKAGGEVPKWTMQGEFGTEKALHGLTSWAYNQAPKVWK